MIYLANFESKIGFHEIREKLKTYCLSPLGKGQVDAMAFSADYDMLHTALEQIKEELRKL